MQMRKRLESAVKASLVHLVISSLVALVAAAIVFLVWYPHPYALLSGGRNLFLLLVGVDLVCGPILTLVLFNPKKPRAELWRDMALVVFIQLAALAYGMLTAYQARPLFLVHEMDRFRVIGLQDFDGVDVSSPLGRLPPALKPSMFSGPVTVGIRDPQDRKERNEVLLESVQGGRDYSQRPEFYIAYDETYSEKAVSRAKPLADFVTRYPAIDADAQKLLKAGSLNMPDALILPVLHRQEWVAVLNRAGRIQGFLPGDGFAVPAK